MNFPHAYWSQNWDNAIIAKNDYCSVCTSAPQTLGCPDNPLTFNVTYNTEYYINNYCQFFIYSHGSSVQTGWYSCVDCWNGLLGINIGENFTVVDIFLISAFRLLPKDCLTIRFILPAGAITYQLSLVGGYFSVNSILNNYQYEFIRIS